MSSNSSRKTPANLIDPSLYGVSFSVKQCRSFGLDPDEALRWLLKQGWRRFRLMSYWNELEKHPGTFDFKLLDKHIRMIDKAGGFVTLCLGVKQPRWPEYHWPDWAHALPDKERDELLIRYLQTTVRHYRDETSIVSWQLENEALLSNFGTNIAIDRRRLIKEYGLVRKLDGTRPIIMSTSNGWGIPVRAPRPNIVGFSYYLRRYERGRYRNTIQSPWLHRLRKLLIWQPVCIHELQCEPWGPKAIWEMDPAEQDKSMSPEQIRRNIAAAKRIKAYPIDLWGGEWWYWRYLRGDEYIWETVRENIF
jgi:hypothetical protein